MLIPLHLWEGTGDTARQQCHKRSVFKATCQTVATCMVYCLPSCSVTKPGMTNLDSCSEQLPLRSSGTVLTGARRFKGCLHLTHARVGHKRRSFEVVTIILTTPHADTTRVILRNRVPKNRLPASSKSILAACWPCLAWKRCQHRRPRAERHCTQGGASAAGALGMPSSISRKKLAGQQGLSGSNKLKSLSPTAWAWCENWSWKT